MGAGSSNYPPGKSGLPVVGVLPSLGDYPQRILKKWSEEKYGPIFYTNFGKRRTIHLNTVKSIKEAFLENSSITSSRPISYVFDQKNGVSFLSDTEKLRTQKAFGQAALRSIEEKNGHGLQRIILNEWKLFQNHLDSLDGKPIELNGLSDRLSGNILLTMLVGERYDYTKNETIVMLFKNLLAGHEDYKSIVITELVPFFRHIPPFKGRVAAYRTRRQKIIDEVKEKVLQAEKDFSESNSKTWLDFMFITKQKSPEESSKYFTTEQLVNFVVDIIGGGMVNVSSAFLWTIVCALLYQESQKRIVAEIEKVFGTDEDPTWESKEKLPYTCAFVDEAYRACCTLTRTIPRATSAELKLSDFVIPKGTELSGNIWGAHHDPTTWPKPMEFDTNRFLDSDGNYVPSENLIPFGVGPRSCFAEYLARIQVFLLLVKTLQVYELTPSGTLPGIYDGTDTITYDPKPLLVTFKRRKREDKKSSA